MKRTSSTENIIKKKPKIPTEELIDYTKSLTSEDAETVESGFQQLDIAEENLGKIKIEKKKKKTQAIKKTVPQNEKENKSSKKTKGKSNTTNGRHILIRTSICILYIF